MKRRPFESCSTNIYYPKPILGHVTNSSTALHAKTNLVYPIASVPDCRTGPRLPFSLYPELFNLFGSTRRQIREFDPDFRCQRQLRYELDNSLSPAAPKRMSEIVNDVRYDEQPKERYYRLDHNLNELVERTTTMSPPWRINLELTQDVHACVDCGKQYSTSSNLARHRQSHRSNGGGGGGGGGVRHGRDTDMRRNLGLGRTTGGSNDHRKSRRCPHCDKCYVSMPAYSMHVRTHNQGCACPHCGKRFSRPWLLQGHVRTHTGEKPFSCNVCGKHFADKSNLRAHVQTHSPDKPFLCRRCGKAFALKSYLYKHEESSCMRSPRSFTGLGLLQHSSQ